MSRAGQGRQPSGLSGAGEPVPVDHAALVAWVKDSCQAQGLPEKVTDPAVLGTVGVLLGGTAQGARAPGA